MSKGQVRLLMRFHDGCNSKVCVGDCYVIDTYDGRGKYIGSNTTHEPDSRKAREILRNDRDYWRRQGFKVVR